MTKANIENVLNGLIEEAYELADKGNLSGMPKKLTDKDSDAFGKYLQYTGIRDVYRKWIDKTINILNKQGVQTSKFKIAINSYDPKKESNLPAQEFMRALKEIEKIRDDRKYRENYLSSKTLPTAHFTKNGVVSQGGKSFVVRKKYREAFRAMWAGRCIVDTKGKKLQKPNPLTRTMLEHSHGITKEKLASMQRAISASRKRSKINITLSYPRGKNEVFLTVVQDIM